MTARRRRAASACALILAAGCSGAPARKTAPGGGEAGAIKGLFAVLETSRGTIEARLLEGKAPRAVAQFVALAKGEREWTEPSGGGGKTRRPLYDGTIFFRVIPGFMIQGGDPSNSGEGGPGYRFADESQSDLSFERPGLLALANSGPDSNGSQFFITLGPAPWLDGKHVIFGEVTKGLDVAEAIAASPRIERDPSSGRPLDRPLEPQILRSVRIETR